MNKLIADLLGGLREHDEEGKLETELTPDEMGLLQASSEWEPGCPDLELDPRVKPFLDRDPIHLKVVRSLQLLLAASRTQTAGQSATAR